MDAFHNAGGDSNRSGAGSFHTVLSSLAGQQYRQTRRGWQYGQGESHYNAPRATVFVSKIG